MTIKEAAAAWGITERRVNELCKTGRISGAYKKGRQWFIPDGTQKPMDKRGRRSAVKPAVSSARKPLPIGVSDYRDACKNYYYVDKTLMIKEFLDERPKVSLFTRPRRFGKTLNMDMLRTFFEKTTEDTSVYFRDKKIWFCGESYRAHHRKYPVIFLSFKDVKYTSWEETYQTLQKLIAQEFRRHDELASSSALSNYEKEEYSILATEAADEVDYQMSLRTLTLLLHKHHDVAPIVIIDEYDTPIQQGHVNGFYDTVIGFMRNLFSGGLKDNPHLSYGFLTGILRVAKESIFSGLNNLKINSILDERYSEYFGFTSDEVREMAEYYSASDKYQELCDWYDGYRFGNTEIFNPWSVIGYFNNNCRPKAFWQSTGSNDIIREVLASATPDKGIGFLFIKKGTNISAYADGGTQEFGLRAGTENVAAIVGMSAALRNNVAHLDDYQSRILSVEQALIDRLNSARINYRRNGAEPRVPGNISLSFPNLDGEAVLHRLDLMGIMVSTGSACDSKSTHISHVLHAIDVDELYAKGTIRISLGKDNTMDEAEKVAGAIIRIASKNGRV